MIYIANKVIHHAGCAMAQPDLTDHDVSALISTLTSDLISALTSAPVDAAVMLIGREEDLPAVFRMCHEEGYTRCEGCRPIPKETL